MAEYIDKESLITNIKQRYCKLCELLNKEHIGYDCVFCWITDIVEDIDGAPAADVAPVMHGEWEYIGTDKMGNVFRCSNCANRIGLDKETDYCPNCGAKMDGGKAK